MEYVINLDKVNLYDVNKVGGKNASIGELIQHLAGKGILVPGGFATTVEAFHSFMEQDGLDKKISSLVNKINPEQIAGLNKFSKQIRQLIISNDMPNEFAKSIADAYHTLGKPNSAVRSSATAEDLKDASFAGQQDTFLNVSGTKNILNAIKLVFASLFTSRAIAYRIHHQYSTLQIGISAGIQPMIRSDKSASGVIFTVDTESGFDKIILLTAAYGLGEGVVQGKITPDEFIVYKPGLEAGHYPILQHKLGHKAVKMVYHTSKDPNESIKTVTVSEKDQLSFSITDEDVIHLAQQAMIIEKHYGRPMDIEWAKDGLNGKIYILQARPETVQSRDNKSQTITHFKIGKRTKIITHGQSVGQLIKQGKARLVKDPTDMAQLNQDEILVTDMTDPDWEPIMRRAAAIVTNRGGRTCHAAIVARELGIPAVVGCQDATQKIKMHEAITVSCAEGQTGFVYEGHVPFEVKEHSLTTMPKAPIKLCINMGNPNKAFVTQFLPNDGVGLARLEFIISNMIGIHPNACLEFDKLSKKLQRDIYLKTAAYGSPTEFYIERLKEGIATIAAAFNPKPVIFRFSDFKSNEYANLLGGDLFEPLEENPMIGFRGAARYIDDCFKQCFKMECLAFDRVRKKMGLSNAQVMIPFVRTIDELKKVIAVMEENGLKRGENGLKVFMMCEVPSNVLLAEAFLEYVDGFSIGSNDLTQLTLGLDRDSNLVAGIFDERNLAVKKLLEIAIKECRKQDKYIGICGQGPSDHPDLAQWLMEQGIESMSLTPDSIVETWLLLSKKKLKSN